MAAPVVALDSVTVPDSTSGEALGEITGAEVTAWMVYVSPAVAGEDSEPAFAAMQRTVMVPGVLKVTLEPDNCVDAVEGVLPSVV